MARLYADVAATFLIHHTESEDVVRDVAATGVRPIACDILMSDREGRARLATDALVALG